jgi:hypothetical protein
LTSLNGDANSGEQASSKAAAAANFGWAFMWLILVGCAHSHARRTAQVTSATNVQSGLSNLRGNSADHFREILCGHLEPMYAIYGELAGVRIARKRLSWYAKERRENVAIMPVLTQPPISRLRLSPGCR